MNVLFLFSNELNAEENLIQARKVFGNVLPIDASGKSKKEAYALLAKAVTNPDEPFIMIEGDNFVYPEAKDLIQDSVLGKYCADSPYGFSYEHGGIKVLTSKIIFSALSKIKTEHDISVYLGLSTISEIPVSRHSFDTSPWNEFSCAAKEIIKLYCWGNKHLLSKWENTRVYDAIGPKLPTITIIDMIDSSKLESKLKEVFFGNYLKIAVLGIMKNEQAHIVRFVSEAKNIGEVFLLDSGSIDESIILAEKHGAKVKQKTFAATNFAEFRNSAIAEFKKDLEVCDYFLFLDIDESLSISNVNDVKEFLGKQKYNGGFSVLRYDISGAPPAKFQRVFNPKCNGEWRMEIHEQFITFDDFAWVDSPIKILHLESELFQTLEKQEKYQKLIIKNFEEAEATEDFVKTFHYFFFFIDIAINECDTETIRKYFQKYVKTWTEMEFSSWYLRKMLRYFILSDDKECLDEMIEIIKLFRPELIKTVDELLSFYNSPIDFDSICETKIRLSKTLDLPSYVDKRELTWTNKLIGEFSPIDFEYEISLIQKFLQANCELLNFETYYEDGLVKIDAHLGNNLDFYQVMASKEGFLITVPLIKKAIKLKLKRKTYLTY